MSFIYDVSLLKELLKIGQQQTGQWEDPESYAHRQSMAQTVKNILDELEKQSAPPPATSEEAAKEASLEVSYEDDPAHPDKVAPQLLSSNLENLGALVDWLTYNKMTVGGQRVSYGLDENPNKPEYVLYKLEPNAGLLEVESREPIKRGFYVNKDVLIKFIQSRQSALSKKPNKMEKWQLDRLINQANRLLGTNIDKEYKAPPLADNTKLDDVPNPVNQSGGNAVPLTFGDIKSLQNFWNWAISKGMSIKDDQNVTKAGTQDFDKCSFISAIAARAKSLYDYRREHGQEYFTQMQAIAQEAGCDISQSSGAQQGQQGQQGGKGTIQDPMVLQRLLGLLPFNSQTVNFREIQKFVNTYAPLARRADISGMAKQINDSIQATQSTQILRQPSMIIPLQQIRAPNDLSAYHRFATNAQFAHLLNTIVNSAGIIYTDFVNTAKNVLKDEDTLEIQRQIDAGGPWSVNMGDINQIMSDLDEEAQHKGWSKGWG